MMEIHVSFSNQETKYSGVLSHVAGGGASDTWYLYVSNYYWGRLRKYQDQWVFDPSKNEWVRMFEKYFGNLVEGSK